MWQYSESGRVPGISGNVDMNYCYKKYPKKNINVTNNTKLEALDITNNQITDINVTKNPKLSYLYCGSNKLRRLNVKKNSMKLNRMIKADHALIFSFLSITKSSLQTAAIAAVSSV